MVFNFRFFAYFFISILLIIYCCKLTSFANDCVPITTENFESQLRILLRSHPELILDILRNNSELILEIAMQGSKQRQHKSLSVQWEKDLHIPKRIHLEKRPFRGNDNAPVTIVAFSDFTCLYCAQSYKTIEKMLDNYKDNVKYIFKHFPLKGNTISHQAAMYFIAASFQSEEKAWILYHNLFQKRTELLQDGEKTLKQAANDAGLDMKKLMSDLNSSAINIILQQDSEDAANIGLNGTPYFLVNNIVLRGALPPELFTEAINMALKHAQQESKDLP